MKRLLFVLVLLGAAGGGGYWYWTTHYASPAGQQQAGAGGRPGGGAGGARRRGQDPDLPVPVVAAKAETRDVPIYLDGLGTVQAYNLVSVKAQIDGPIVEVRFREGQNVKAGDVLVKIDPRPYQAALDQAMAKKQQDESTLANSRLDLARYAKLAPMLGSSQQQIDTARAAVGTQEAIVRGDQAQVDTANTNLSYTTIKAAIDGRVGIRQVDLGNIVHQGDAVPMTVITQLKPISVVFTLPQQSLGPVTAAIGGGAEAMPEVLALAGGGTRRVLDRGRVAVLDNQVDPATGTIKLKATFPNDELKLWPGGFVNVRLLVETQKAVTTVPAAAVQRGPRGTYVFVVNADNTVKRAMVTVGHEDEATSVIVAGLAPGDLVVIDGAQRLNDASKVAVAGPDLNAPDAAPRERTAPGTAQRRQRTAG